MKVLVNRKDANETAKVIMVDEQRKTQMLEFITGERVGKTLSYSNSTIKRWWKVIEISSEETKEELVKHNNEKEVKKVTEKISSRNIKKEKSKKAFGTIEVLQKVKTYLEELGFTVVPYPSNERFLSVFAGGKKKFAEVDVNAKNIQVYRKVNVENIPETVTERKVNWTLCYAYNLDYTENYITDLENLLR